METDKMTELMNAYDASIEIMKLLEEKFGHDAINVAVSNSITATLIALDGMIDTVEELYGVRLREIVANAIMERNFETNLSNLN